MGIREFRETAGGSSKLLLLIFRHVIVPPFVSFVTSFATLLLPGVFLIAVFGQHLGRAMCFTLIGFCGVLAGACCLPVPRTRRWGALALTALGLIFYSGYVADWGNVMTDDGKIINEHHRSLVQLIQLGVGGLLATTLISGLSSAAFQRFRQNHYGSDIPCPPIA